jgi:tRNA (guanine-N7-)-methyltransferase
MSETRHRPIRSFVRREGRLTAGQRRALEQLWPRYGIELPEDADALRSWLWTDHPVTLEIGFGNGDTLAEMASQNPDRRFLGIEVHRPGVGHLLQLIEREGLENLRIVSADAVEVLREQIPEASLDTVLVFFPDPWPKKRHHKRRLVQQDFVGLVASRLKPGGRFHLATDWEDYAQQMLVVLEASEGFDNATGPGQFAPRPDYRPPTKFERRGQRLGHDVWDLIYRRRP